MKTSQYFSRKIKALTADKQENLQAPLLYELSDSETSKIVGGNNLLADESRRGKKRSKKFGGKPGGIDLVFDDQITIGEQKPFVNATYIVTKK